MYRVVFVSAVDYPMEVHEALAAAVTDSINEHVRLGWQYISFIPMPESYGAYLTFVAVPES
ncbi:hypothetical protein [Lentzea flaviverrucosa]|uniref:DUF4177 domain-containing protein n=1 Tax=Lentzea flaviverrucosa TaxID=200379 RepID=A0A1H9TQB2_9PSEU|nr:hypothetical protein [Lentzea flaviverrucosa]RDI33509.1 hypothetical protein DFR72_102758 [Lentzea flaviverrucosa]SER99540.1 hypothetical protein SAMN05216195_10898 [Lentzea flaviverrucosa]